jgi:hypothetical protein
MSRAKSNLGGPERDAEATRADDARTTAKAAADALNAGIGRVKVHPEAAMASGANTAVKRDDGKTPSPDAVAATLAAEKSAEKAEARAAKVRADLEGEPIPDSMRTAIIVRATALTDAQISKMVGDYKAGLVVTLDAGKWGEGKPKS